MTAGDPAPLPAEDVARAATAWLWYPPDAEVGETERFLLVRFPGHFNDRLQVLRTWGPADDDLVREVLDRAQEWRVPEEPHLTWWVKLDAPPGLEELLRPRGQVEETLTVLARPYAGAGPDLDVPADVELRPVVDRDTARHAFEVEAAVFGGSVPGTDQVDALVSQCRDERDSDQGERYVAYVDGVAVGSAGLAHVDGVVRLWGGCVLESHRRRGVYRALLDARLRWGAERGARMALVKGRVQTSAPVLRRAGFTAYGEERSYRLPL